MHSLLVHSSINDNKKTIMHIKNIKSKPKSNVPKVMVKTKVIRISYSFNRNQKFANSSNKSSDRPYWSYMTAERAYSLKGHNSVTGNYYENGKYSKFVSSRSDLD